MIKIFIDSNIYLDFYERERSGSKEYLDILVKIKKNILVTGQIRNEIIRRKVQVFSDHFLNEADLNACQYPIQKLLSMEATDGSCKKQIKNMSKKLGKINTEIRHYNAEKINIFQKELDKVAKSEDFVSKKLEVIFSQLKEVKEEHYVLARKRRDQANPPGKRENSFCDQINWEICLDNISKNDDLVIVCKDKDYLVNAHNRMILNPLLTADLKKKNGKVNAINVFTKLSEALEYLQKPLGFQIKKKKIVKDKGNSVINTPSVNIIMASPYVPNMYSNYISPQQSYGGAYVGPIMSMSNGPIRAIDVTGGRTVPDVIMGFLITCPNCGHTNKKDGLFITNNKQRQSLRCENCGSAIQV